VTPSELLAQLETIIKRNEYLEAENARLKTRLEAQIGQSVKLSLENMALKAHPRKLDGETPEYVAKEAQP
jgi:cell division protein FtsB